MLYIVIKVPQIRGRFKTKYNRRPNQMNYYPSNSIITDTLGFLGEVGLHVPVFLFNIFGLPTITKFMDG